MARPTPAEVGGAIQMMQVGAVARALPRFATAIEPSEMQSRLTNWRIYAYKHVFCETACPLPIAMACSGQHGQQVGNTTYPVAEAVRHTTCQALEASHRPLLDFIPSKAASGC